MRGRHAASHSRVAKDFYHGFYWLSAQANTRVLVDKCNGCQHFLAPTHQPDVVLQINPLTWPFVVWGLDLVRPLYTIWGGVTHLLVAIAKFSKWVMANPIKKLHDPMTIIFIKDIAVCYGLLNNINFSKGTLAHYCEA